MQDRVRLAIVLTLQLITNLISTNAMRCDTIPEGTSKLASKSVPDNRFILTISGNVDKFTPNEKYTVSLKSHRENLNSQVPKFIGFTIVVEPVADPYSSVIEEETRSVGFMHLYGESLTKFSDSCPNMVTHTSLTPKSEVSVLWSAPPPGSGCVTIKATVTEHKDVWFQDGPLSRTICENVLENFNNQPPVVKECCACNEAKYEVTFEGLWSRHTHPKDFPSNSWLTRFSDVIGASHTTNYSFWEYGGTASEGLRQVATTGTTRLLESELKDESQNIRTIIKARGISYPNVTGKTFAVFRVDRKHHLISLVSMLDPSPDWIVGVSKLELCLDNCSWVENKIINLYPWDAGIDSGITYISPEQPTNPQENIIRINSSYPNDTRSPFYDPSGEEMKPLARLYLNRQRTYERSCVDSEESSTDEDDPCEMKLKWSNWSDCIETETCGVGFQTRQREYKDSEKAVSELCSKQVTQRRNCSVYNSNCSPIFQANEYYPECEQAEWGEWSSCSATCGRGNKVRLRVYNGTTDKICQFSEFQETRECEESDCSPPTYPDKSLDDNPLCPWSQWSVCMATCGKGKQIRNRIKIKNDGNDDICQGLMESESVDCESNVGCEVPPEKAPEVCQLPKDIGPCRGYKKRWFFDMLTQYCQEFIYTGCRGNRNNFKSLKECEKTCGNFKDGDTGTGISSDSLIGVTTEQPGNDDEILIGDKCEYSRWSRWSPCSKRCGKGGIKTRTRKVLRKPPGNDCESTEQTKNCRGKDCASECRYTQWSPWSPCSATCGSVSLKQRIRNVYPGKHINSEVCTERVEERNCTVLPCD